MELKFLKVLMLIRKSHQKKVLFVVSIDKVFRFQPAVCSGCHDVLIISIHLNSITVLNVHGVDYYCIIARITKRETINLLRKDNLSKKSGSS